MGFWTWNPLHSKETREICDHMTPEERRKFLNVSAIAGLGFGLAGMLFIGPLVKWWSFNNALTTNDLIRIALGVTVQLVVLIGARHLARKTLSGTEWAQQQGYTAETLKTDIFSRRKRGE